VTLFNHTPERVAAIKARRGIDLESCDGGPRGFGRLEGITSDIAEALAEADVVHVVVPSSAHAEVAKAAAPHLRDGQIVLLHPGRTLDHRCIFEDIPMSLVPIAALGQPSGVSVRRMDAIIRLACIIHRADYWRRGHTLDKLGTDRLSVGELTQFVNNGWRNWEG
jgi:ketopantoate reductase